jgi:hypothetical protein
MLVHLTADSKVIVTMQPYLEAPERDYFLSADRHFLAMLGENGSTAAIESAYMGK